MTFLPNAKGYLFTLNKRGGDEVLTENADDEIHTLGHLVAGLAGDGVLLRFYTTDRAVASITVPAAEQAKHGALTKAASQAGLEVKLK